MYLPKCICYDSWGVLTYRQCGFHTHTHAQAHTHTHLHTQNQAFVIIKPTDKASITGKKRKLRYADMPAGMSLQNWIRTLLLHLIPTNMQPCAHPTSSSFP